MNHFFTKLFLISAFATSFVFAQNAGPTTHTPNPANMAERRVKFLTTLLTLNTNQQAQAVAIFTNSITLNLTVGASLKAARQNLRTAVETNEVGSLSGIAATIGSLEGQETLNNAQADAAFYQILSAPQQTQFTQYQTQGHGGGFGFGPAFRGGH